MTVVQGTTDNRNIQFPATEDKKEEVSLSSLAALTGFSEEFIKDELLLSSETDDIPIDQLRAKMLLYLKKNFQE